MSTSRRSLLLLSAAGTAFPFPNGPADAPRFRAKSLAGETFDNASIAGKVVLVQMWATWCGYCRRDQPAVDEVIAEYSSQGLVVLAVNMGENKKKVLRYLEDSPRQGHIILMPDTNLAAAFRADSLPYYVAINRAGKVVKEQRGASGSAGLQQLLAAAGLG